MYYHSHSICTKYCACTERIAVKKLICPKNHQCPKERQYTVIKPFQHLPQAAPLPALTYAYPDPPYQLIALHGPLPFVQHLHKTILDLSPCSRG